MSADGHAICPKCLPEAGPADDEDLDLREWYEIYIRDGQLNIDYYAECWCCGFSFALKHEHQIPGL